MIAVDLPNQRIYVRGNMHQAYSWLMDRYKEDWAHILRNHHFPMRWPDTGKRSEDHEWLAEYVLTDSNGFRHPVPSGWTIEHNPEPLNPWLADGFVPGEEL